MPETLPPWLTHAANNPADENHDTARRLFYYPLLTNGNRLQYLERKGIHTAEQLTACAEETRAFFRRVFISSFNTALGELPEAPPPALPTIEETPLHPLRPENSPPEIFDKPGETGSEAMIERISKARIMIYDSKAPARGKGIPGTIWKDISPDKTPKGFETGNLWGLPAPTVRRPAKLPFIRELMKRSGGEILDSYNTDAMVVMLSNWSPLSIIYNVGPMLMKAMKAAIEYRRKSKPKKK